MAGAAQSEVQNNYQSGLGTLSVLVERPPEQNRSVIARPSRNQSRKFISQTAFTLFAASLALILAMVGKQEIVLLYDTVSFKVFIVTDLSALLCSLAVAVILATDPEMPEKITWLIVMAATIFFLSSLMAAGFVVMIAVVKWIAVCYVAATVMVVALLIYCLLKV